MFLSSIFLLSYLIRIFELPFFRETDGEFAGDIELFDAIWLIVMTVTSVGYGDMVPHTTPGKWIAMFSAVWGIVLISLLVVATTHMFSLTENQHQAEKHIRLTRSAAKTINLSAKYFLIKKKFYIEKIKFNP